MRRKTLMATLAVAVIGFVCITAPSQEVSHGDSPSFRALHAEAVAHLEGVTRQITRVGVGNARAEDHQLTHVSEPTCGFDFTCVAHLTCDDAVTCWLHDTCVASGSSCPELTYSFPQQTCDTQVQTCDAATTCLLHYTCDWDATCNGAITCDGSETCYRFTSNDCETCDGISETCTDMPECRFTYQQGRYTCIMHPNCPTVGVEDDRYGRTTWGKVKEHFNE